MEREYEEIEPLLINLMPIETHTQGTIVNYNHSIEVKVPNFKAKKEKKHMTQQCFPLQIQTDLFATK